MKKGITEHHTTHRPFEESQQGEKTGKCPFLVHVSQGIKLGEKAEACDQLQRNNVGKRETEADIQIQISHREPGKHQVYGTGPQDFLKNQTSMGESQKRQKDVEVSSSTMSLTAEPAAGPGQSNDHSGESVKRNQPGGLNGNRELRSQDGERNWNRACRWMADESKRRTTLQGDYVDRCRKGKPESELIKRSRKRTGEQRRTKFHQIPNQKG